MTNKPTEDDQEKSKVIEESDSTIPDPSHQTVTSTPPVIAPFIDVSSIKPSKTEAADIMKALKESKKMSKRQPGTGGSNEGTGNILGVPDESTWEADVVSEHFDRDDNAGDDNEETKPDPEEIYK
ncbi:hypothetical protein Tco_1420921 [Tanacetum coccineum]